MPRFELPGKPKHALRPAPKPAVPAEEPAALKEAASLLGRRAARTMTQDQRSARARKGGEARWAKQSQLQKETLDHGTSR
jgi:hypothetical protein